MLILSYNMNFDSPYNHKETENRIYKLWEKSELFNPDKLPGKRDKKFSVMMAPPNITGSLHMGHVLENTEVDILVRMKRMQGFKTLWLPGIDHAGIAAQNVVEKELRKEGLHRQDLGREKFEQKIKEWKEKYGTIILDQLKMLGISSDWSRTRYTMDSDYSKAVLEAFKHYYKKGWIYRGERVINWCVRCATSISDLEVNYVPEMAKLYFIKYGPFILATVRPETKLGDTALAVHPNDKRYKKYVGENLEIESIDNDLPLNQPAKAKKIKIKVVADKAVDPKFGTGIIKVTPAHDITDFEIAKRHNLPSITIIDEHGRMNENAGLRYLGMKTAEAREQIVKDLKAIGLIEKIEDYDHNIVRCDRCNSVIEPLPSKQWFLKMNELAKLAIDVIKNKETTIHPKKWEKVLLHRLNNERDWNISRQLWWGHQLPIWFCENQIEISNSQFLISKYQFHRVSSTKSGQFENLKLKIKNSSAEQFVVSANKPKECPFCKNCTMKQSADVLDTWFSSALWPFATLGWPENSKDLENYYPTDFITSARDILNIWIAKMIFSGMEFMGKTPFKITYIHATILNKEGKRMSKSLGTGVDPIDLIECFGADATRFGLIWQDMGSQDIHWSQEHVVAGKKFANKIWNATRFVLQNANSQSPLNLPLIKGEKKRGSEGTKGRLKNKNLTEADKKIISGLKKTTIEIGNLIEKYEFGQALHKLYDFFWHEYADIYIETAKKQLTDEKIIPHPSKKGGGQTQNVLLKVHSDLLKLLHPFMPFITEELWTTCKKFSGSESLLLTEDWPK